MPSVFWRFFFWLWFLGEILKRFGDYYAVYDMFQKSGEICDLLLWFWLEAITMVMVMVMVGGSGGMAMKR